MISLLYSRVTYSILISKWHLKPSKMPDENTSLCSKQDQEAQKGHERLTVVNIYTSLPTQ